MKVCHLGTAVILARLSSESDTWPRPSMVVHVSIIFQAFAGLLLAPQGFDEQSRFGNCKCVVFKMVLSCR